MSSVRPFPIELLPRISRVQVDAGRALLDHLPLEPGPDWKSVEAALGGRVVISLDEVRAISDGEVGDALLPVVIALEALGGRRALLSLDAELAAKLAARMLTLSSADVPVISLRRPLTLAEQGALEFLACALIGPTARVLGIVHAKDETFEKGIFHLLSAQVESPVGRGSARLILPDSLRVNAPRPRAIDDARLETLSFALRIEAGRVAIPRRDFVEIGIGDVVLFEQAAIAVSGSRVRIALGRGGYDADIDQGRIVLRSHYRFFEGEENMAREVESGALLQTLPIELICEIGRVNLTARELLSLEPGAVLTVGKPLGGPVELTASGRVVARGELVDVEGELGVRVTQIQT